MHGAVKQYCMGRTWEGAPHGLLSYRLSRLH